MVRIVCVLLVLLTSASLSAQNIQRIDSLRKLLPARADKEQFDILNSLAWEYRLIIPDSTIKIGNQALALGKKLALQRDLSKPLNFIGVGYEYKGMSIEAYENFKEALKVATEQNDIVQIAYANNNLGRLFLDQGNILKALDAHFTALQIFDDLNDPLGKEFVHLNLAQLYQSQQEYKKAEEYYLKVYQNRKKMERGPNISSSLNLGKFYREIDDMEKSYAYLATADSLCKVKTNQIQHIEVYYQLAENLLKDKRLDEASRAAQNALTISFSKGLNAARIYDVLGKIKFEQNNAAEAKEYFKKVLQHAQTFKSLDLKMDAHYYLFKLYSKDGATEKKLQSENQYLALKDSLKEIELTKQIEKLKFQFNLELEQKKRENELLKTLDSKNTDIIKKQQTINTIYAVALLVIIVVAFLLFRNAKIKNRLNIELEKKQEKILRQSEELKAINLEIEKINANLEKTVEARTKTISEKNKLLMEYAYFNSHQIRGPLARILGLIQLLNMEYKDDFGGHLGMLQQAGNDLDDAIHKINKLIDNVSEKPSDKGD